MPRLIFVFFLAVAFSCCQNQQKPEPAPPEQATAEPAPTPEATLPSVPIELLQKIWDEGTQVDLIFYHLPFTMSMDEKPAIQHAVRHIAETPAPIKPECSSFGRITYQIDGDIVLEGDFFFSTGCTYFVFYENQEKKYANYMTDEGIQYFNAQIQQASQLQKQAQGQGQ